MNDKELIIAAAQLAQTAAGSWEKFLAALRAHNAAVTNQLVSSPIEVLPVAQGRAKHAQELLTTLENCRTVAEQIEKGQKSNVRTFRDPHDPRAR